MVSSSAEHRVTFPLLKAQWLCQTFVHWPYEPAVVQSALPPGLSADLYDDAAWVSFTPFLMSHVRPPGPSAAPRATFPETNLRTYVRLEDGTDALWFFSLEVSSALMLTARLAGAPYHLGDLSLRTRGDGSITYTGVRRGGTPSYHLTVRPGPALVPDGRDIWLTSRWRAVTRRAGRLWQTPVEHEPWPLSTAREDGLEQSLTQAAGLPPPDGTPVLHFSPGVRRVRLGAPRPVARPRLHGSS
ncbi:YqjF family protein [Streptomyces sp. QH1-20]|uniref:YqjF family protein n=1 Tax=Streptomyces sp. QH1-20 TaxID=3240934 RepID=UPI003514A119